jgi:phage terminase large subunit-like protein
VLSWQAGHVKVKTDPNNNKRPVKPPAEDLKKIDGIVAGVMGLARCMLGAGKSEPTITFR